MPKQRVGIFILGREANGLNELWGFPSMGIFKVRPARSEKLQSSHNCSGIEKSRPLLASMNFFCPIIQTFEKYQMMIQGTGISNFHYESSK